MDGKEIKVIILYKVYYNDECQPKEKIININKKKKE